MIENNICLLTDSYKVTHHYFYPKGTEKIYSYLESRVGAEFNKTIFYGLQYIIKKYLEGSVVTQEKIDEADKLISAHIGEGIFNKEGWEYILDEYDGKLPIEIKAVAEGTPVDVSNVLMTVENTDRKSYWLVNYLESLLLQVWYPSTVATLSAEVRKLSNFYLDVTGSQKDNLDFMLHDFGYRGATSTESSMLCGSAHLLSFSGTDTIPALTIPENYYNDSNLYGFSVQATEHSVMTSLGPEGEFDQIMNEVPRDYLDVSSKITYQLPTVENIRPEYFECICSSVRDRICLDVEYENVKGDRSRRLVETEQLINYSGAWYIVAFDRKNEAVRTFNVSRITSLSLSKEKFSQHGSEYEKELRDFLNSGFGIFHGKSSQIVKVEFTGEAARIVKTQTWHEKQVMEISENLPGQECLTLEFPAANFTELVGKILSFGKKARPLEPPELVDLWKEEILGMKKMFD